MNFSLDALLNVPVLAVTLGPTVLLPELELLELELDEDELELEELLELDEDELELEELEVLVVPSESFLPPQADSIKAQAMVVLILPILKVGR